MCRERLLLAPTGRRWRRLTLHAPAAPFQAGVQRGERRPRAPMRILKHCGAAACGVVMRGGVRLSTSPPGGAALPAGWRRGAHGSRLLPAPCAAAAPSLPPYPAAIGRLRDAYQPSVPPRWSRRFGLGALWPSRRSERHCNAISSARQPHQAQRLIRFLRPTGAAPPGQCRCGCRLLASVCGAAGDAWAHRSSMGAWRAWIR